MASLPHRTIAPSTQRPNRAARRHPEKAQEQLLCPRWATINATADYIGVTERTVRQMIRDGRLVGYRIGARFIRLDLNEVDAALQEFGGAVNDATDGHE
jgi:excisionase family DNA binding protein